MGNGEERRNALQGWSPAGVRTNLKRRGNRFQYGAQQAAEQGVYRRDDGEANSTQDQRKRALMKPRERVQRAITFQEADRVPIDLGGMVASTIAVEAYHKLKLKLGLTGTPRVLDPRAMIPVVEEPVLKRFSVDVMPLNTSAITALASPDCQWIPRRLFSG